MGDPPDPYFHISFTAFGTLMCQACLTFYGHIKGMKARWLKQRGVCGVLPLALASLSRPLPAPGLWQACLLSPSGCGPRVLGMSE